MTAITIVGAGVVGTNLATAFAATGADVRFAARDRQSDKVTAAGGALGADVVPLDRAAVGSDLVFLAVPYGAVVDTVTALGDVGPAVLVDVTNSVGEPLPPGADSILDVISTANADATLVKAFNTIGAEAFVRPAIDGIPLFLPIAGDPAGVDEVWKLATAIGFDAIVIGDRSAARVLEHTAELWIHLAFRTGLGRDFGFARLTR